MPQESQSSRFSANVLKLIGGTTLAQVLTILTAPIISRLFSPEHIGAYSILVSLISVFSIVICLRYELSIMLPAEDGDASNLVALSLGIAGSISLAATILLLFARQALLDLLNAPELSPYLWVFPLALLIQGIYLTSNNWNTRKKRFGRLSIARVSASLTTSIVPILLALTGYANTAGLIYAWLAGTTVFAAVLALQVFTSDWHIFRSNVRISSIQQALYRYRKFPLLDTWGAFINNLSWQLPTLMLSSYFSSTIVGYYSLANRVILLPLTLVGNSIAQVFFQRAAEVHAGQSGLGYIVSTVYRRLVSISILPAIVLAIAGKELFVFVFGASWAEAGVYAQILAPWMFFLFISSPLSQIFAILERQELAFGVHAVILLTRILALTIGGAFRNAYVALWLWTITGVLVYGALAVINLRLVGLDLKDALRPIARIGKYALPVALILWALKSIIALSTLGLVVASLLLGSLYFLLAIREDADFYRGLFRQMVPVQKD